MRFSVTSKTIFSFAYKHLPKIAKRWSDSPKKNPTFHYLTNIQLFNLKPKIKPPKSGAYEHTLLSEIWGTNGNKFIVINKGKLGKGFENWFLSQWYKRK